MYLDKDIENIVAEDIGIILQDTDSYEECPIERVLRDKSKGYGKKYVFDRIKIYVLEVSFGGIALIGTKYNTEEREWKIVMLGEDDGYFSCSDNYYLPQGKKTTILDLLGRAMSLMNNIEE